MKYLFIFFMLTCYSAIANNVNSIALDKSYKVESTFSGNTGFNESFHLILTRNIEKKQAEIIPIINRGGNLSKLPSIVFDELPSIQSFHNNGNVVTLIMGLKEKKDNFYVVVDVNLLTGASKKSDIISGKDFKAVIRKDTKNILVFSNKRRLDLVEINSANTIRKIKVIVKKSMWSFLEDLDSNTLEAVNTEEFVANGSIREFKAYSYGKDLFITQENPDKGFTSVAKMSLVNDDVVPLEIKTYTLGEKTKKLASYVSNSKLFQLKTNKENGVITIYNLNNGSPESFDLLSIKTAKQARDFEDMEDYLKKASKSKHEPTISVNQTNSGNLLLRIDYVLKNAYGYQYNWWWYHQWMFQQQMMMMHQQQIRAVIPSGFGPFAAEYDMYPVAVKECYFEVILDPNNNLVNSDDAAVYKFIDKQKHIEEVDSNTKIKDASTMFLKDEMRYFGYDAKSKSFKVISKRIND